MNGRYVKAVVGLVVVFAVFIPVFYFLSYGKNDGLQQAVSEGGGNPEPDPVWTSPFSYGSSPLETFLFGLLGFALIFLLVYGLVRLARVRRVKHETATPDEPHRP
ncbi:MAG TPA: hypothetical protein VIB49_10020 [Thermoplasmata archaeon]|jgi:hypothetical protein